MSLDFYVCERERERGERNIDKGRHSYRDTVRVAEKQRQRETEKQTHIETERKSGREELAKKIRDILA